MDRIERLEERQAQIEHMVDELSDVIARQESEIATLTRRVQMLLSREAERELDTGGQIPLADQRPPHW